MQSHQLIGMGNANYDITQNKLSKLLKKDMLFLSVRTC